MPLINVLHVYPQLNCGGTEMVIYNLIKFADKEQFSFSILVQRHGEQDAVFEELGCKIIVIPFFSNKDYQRQLTILFSSTRFDAVHAHMHNEMGSVLKAAKDAGITHRVSHSHNARTDIPKVLWPLRFFKHNKFERYATELFGCSEMALRWLFPVRWKEGWVIYNAIDLSLFSYNESKRTQIRQAINASDSTKVIINVGRCTAQKNQGFILDRAKDLMDRDLRFVIIGEGPLLTELEKRIQSEGIRNVSLLGKRFDVADWLSASDMFILPSLYEGLGIVAVEAQATGLPVVATDTIPDEVDLGFEIFNRIPLKDPRRWNKFLVEGGKSIVARKEISQKTQESNYNIQTLAKYVCGFYLGKNDDR